MTGMLVGGLSALAVLVLVAPSGRSRRPVAGRAERGGGNGTRDAPMILDLLAAVLSAGASVESSLAVVADSCEADIGAALRRVHAARLLGASWDTAWDTAGDPAMGAGAVAKPVAVAAPRRARPGARQRLRLTHHSAACVADVRQGLRFATSTGAPSAALLHAHAAQLRRRLNREIDRRAAALGVQLVLPLGLCSLPAFICLGVVPVVLGLLPAL
ncbi:type II secretion system F family protein [Arthrobacter echini]|uniref:Type II secretion system F family protein n=1 Tax=Arthrobacter echini TaxID=1529066 RepID=A0A4S5E9N3_9MICC|nr:type II secretion system F family protein [Arthrobacter echini]THJ68411.1 type II secretion system F family protein [Arthrobacter echini]